ncbi:MAG: TlpA family protein disulfide reductase [Acidobacteriia bacterium]|nr:TlpA family protein disulfide reductase [Terriglobia bacterium]
MPRKNILVVLVLAGVALILAGSTYFLHRDAGHAGFSALASTPAQPAAAESADAPVIRFVKNPEMAPAFQAQDILGKPVTNADWPGKVVLVNFWATWCPPCRMEIPELLELKKEYGDRLEIIGISEDDDPPAKVLKFAQSVKMTYPIVMYTPEIVASYGGVPALPTSFLIDTKGRVVTKHSGLYPIERYDQEIRALLGMPIEARIETFIDQGQIFLKNAANATELPGVDFKGLTADQKKGALRRMNAETCTCGCGLTVSQCRVNDSECPTSKGIAAQIVKDAASGVKPPAEPAAKGTKSISQ